MADEELMPWWVWRRRLDEELAKMTLKDPTINHDRLEHWDPPGRAIDRNQVLIRKSLVGSAFIQIEPPKRREPQHHVVEAEPFSEADGW